MSPCPAHDSSIASLAERASALRARHPGIRARDLALLLEVSEAELVASRCGGAGTTRLRSDWPGLFGALPTLGRVMALTRNRAAIHEKTGAYANVTVSERMGLVLNDDIDLRLFPAAWRQAFAVEEETRSGRRRSVQIFDRHGDAVHKVYELLDSPRAPLDALVERFRDDDQGPEIDVEPSAAPARAEDGPIDLAAFWAGWDALQDTHDFFGLLRRFGLSRPRALDLAGAERAWQVAPAALAHALGTAAAAGLPIMVFVGNRGMIQIHTGPITRVAPAGDWINVLDPGFNLHVRGDLIDRAWVVRKPTADGVVTSLELFDSGGETIAMLFGKRKPGQPEDRAWRSLIEAEPRLAR